MRAEPPTQAKGATAVGVLVYAQPLWGKFCVEGQLGIGWTDEVAEAGEIPLDAEGAWETAVCWPQSAFLDEVPVARLATDIIVTDMVVTDDIAADLVATEIFAKGASEDMGALGECTGTLRAKSGHLSRMTEPLRGSAAFSPIPASTMILPHQVVRNLTNSAMGRTR